LKARFWKIRFAKAAPGKAFGGLEIKNISPDPPHTPKHSHAKTPAELYFDILMEKSTSERAVNRPAMSTEGLRTQRRIDNSYKLSDENQKLEARNSKPPSATMNP
jgi:hypothetical protein